MKLAFNQEKQENDEIKCGLLSIMAIEAKLERNVEYIGKQDPYILIKFEN